MDNLIQFIISGITTGSIYALIAVGFSVIHNSTGIVNLLQCEFITYGGLLTVTFYIFSKLPLIVAIPLSILFVAIFAGLFERIIIRKSKSQDIIILIFITIGASILFRGVALLLWGPEPYTLPSFSGEKVIKFFNATLVPQNLWIISVTFITVLSLHFFFKKTITGKAMRAVAINKRAASIVGININRMVNYSFVISGILGSIAGIIVAPITTTSYDIGFMIGLKGFAAAILGGYGSMAGSVVGGLLLGILENVGAGFVSSTYKDVIAFVILLLVLFVKPTGILGSKYVDKV
jgi:branched-chain amino acid transport system permease protein